MAETVKLPLTLERCGDDYDYDFVLCGADGVSVCTVYAEAKAAFICRAVNSHADLVAALKWALADIETRTHYTAPDQRTASLERAHAALKSAEG